MRNHGTISKYRQDKCRCVPCREAKQRIAKRQRYREHVKAAPMMTPVYSAALMVNWLMYELNWTQKEIGDATGTGRQVIYRVGARRQPYIHRVTYLRLTNLMRTAQPHPVRFRGRQQNDLVKLGLRGLYAQGYTMKWISEQLDVSTARIKHHVTAEGQWILPEFEEQVIKLVQEIGSRQGPDRRARNIAAKRGWKATMYVDELV